MDKNGRVSLRRWASQIATMAHFFGATTFGLFVIWLLQFGDGINLSSENARRVFNVHPFLMFIGFIFLAGEASMAYKTISAGRDIQKLSHMFLNLVALVVGSVGIYAAFKFHNMVKLSHMESLHSWIGITTFFLFALQWVFGFIVFVFPKAANTTRARSLPWHICVGRALLYMSICAAISGLIQQKQVAIIPLQQQKDRKNESRLINFIGVSTIVFGFLVDMSLALVRYT